MYFMKISFFQSVYFLLPKRLDVVKGFPSDNLQVHIFAPLSL